MQDAALQEKQTSGVLEEQVFEARTDLKDSRERVADLQSEASSVKAREAALETRAAELEAQSAAMDEREAKLTGAEAEAAKNEFGNGVHIVGSTVNPGTYSTAGSNFCYYAWKSGTGADADIRDNNIIQGPGVVTLSDGDIFETSRCGRWTKTD